MPSIPIAIRAFCKALYDKHKPDTAKVMKLVAKYVIEDWLAKAAFEDTVTNGLLKTYFIKPVAASNIQLMGTVIKKFF